MANLRRKATDCGQQSGQPAAVWEMINEKRPWEPEGQLVGLLRGSRSDRTDDAANFCCVAP